MQIRPQHAAIDVFDHLKEMMVVAPIDSYEDETEDIAEENRSDGAEHRQTVPQRHAQLEHHNGDDDRDHTIAKGFQSGAGHRGSLQPRLVPAPKRIKSPA